MVDKQVAFLKLGRGDIKLHSFSSLRKYLNAMTVFHSVT